ncbi:hypothetical protein [Nocardia aurantiaca]|uniref:Uncharacterized protein n=1 Tax=Nocardia aurantiaca TaxID=2675850 RepID=A0A6I3L3M0_9NOCA|nr:hypothetical protein [Nocardia aurantiaca]MTE15185.1 hypothetical protein [Nocardia aurantiaca]
MNILLKVPVLASAEEKGLVLDVAAVGIENPATTGRVYVRLTDGSSYHVPDGLTDWAIALLGVQQNQRAEDMSLFPCKVEFGVRDGRMYAEILERP